MGDNGETFLLSVDGTHCRIQEPKHPTRSKNPESYSHKFHQAGLAYELALSVWDDRLVWMNFPFKASVPDIKIFRSGLKGMIPMGKKVIADNGYRGDILCTPNSRDCEYLAWQKSRGA